MFRRGIHRKSNFTGLFSPKFRLKTGTTGRAFIDFVQANMDADACMINPFPQMAYFSFNMWTHGDTFHPGLIERAQKLFDESGVDVNIANIGRQGPDTICYCNFWVGTEQFWNEYVGGILLPIAEFLEREPNHAVAKSVMVDTQHTVPAPFLPFIIERLFSTFLSSKNKLIVRSYPMNPMGACLNDFEREAVRYFEKTVREADRQKSFPPELARCSTILVDSITGTIRRTIVAVPHPHTGYRMKLLREEPAAEPWVQSPT